MSSIGLPAFQFIQDDLDYDARVHHTALIASIISAQPTCGRQR